MIAKYYLNMNSYNQDPAELIEQLLYFFSDQVHEAGELFFNDFDGVKIIYNIKTGEVELSAIEQHPGVSNYYSQEMFRHVLAPLIEAISLQAKIDLLWELNQLGDKEISHIIRKHHVFPQKQQTRKMLTPFMVEKTLLEIKQLGGGR
jgi:hypothetical protein